MEWLFNGKGLAQKGCLKGFNEKGKNNKQNQNNIKYLYQRQFQTNALISTYLTESYYQLQFNQKLMHRIDSKRPYEPYMSQSIY